MKKIRTCEEAGFEHGAEEGRYTPQVTHTHETDPETRQHIKDRLNTYAWLHEAWAKAMGFIKD